MRSWRDRVPGFVLTALMAGAALSANAQEPRAVVNQYCIACHNSKLKTAGLALDASAATIRPTTRRSGRKSYAACAFARCRPSDFHDRPTPPTSHSSERFETSLDRAAAAHPNPGRTDTFRRLNRTEYQNAIRDLLALEVDVASLLPSDDASHGFDNVTVGDLSPTLLERYVSAARKISRLAVGSPMRVAGWRHRHLSARPHAGRALRRAAPRHARRHWRCTTPSRSTANTKSSSA